MNAILELPTVGENFIGAFLLQVLKIIWRTK